MQIMIDGTDITDFIAFRGLKWSRNDVDGPNAGRNMSGSMIRDRVGTKMRLDVTCRPLRNSEHQLLMNLLMPEFVSVYYDDPVRGTGTCIMYANNHSSEYCMRKANGEEWWHNVSFPLVEK